MTPGPNLSTRKIRTSRDKRIRNATQPSEWINTHPKYFDMLKVYFDLDRVLPEGKKCALLKQNGSSSNNLFMLVDYVTKILVIYVKEVDNIFKVNKRITFKFDRASSSK